MMMRIALARMDQIFAARSSTQILFIAACGVGVVGFLDHLTGYELSISVLYLGPVLMAAWYVGRLAGSGISLLACASWFVADAVAGQPLAHPIIEAWNTLVRLSYFVVLSVLATALRKSLSHERQLARTDTLTGLFGRRAFEERLEHDLALARRRESALTIAYLDLDNFKTLNDTHGHAEGDRVLRTIGRVLGENRRGGDTVARLGGDEFALVFPDTDQRMAQKVITNLRQDLRKAFERGPWRFSCSVGVVTFQTAPPNLAEAISAADALMYDAKRQGKDVVAFKVVEQVTGGPAQLRSRALVPKG
jgi:diguanylate cyclase (GGDEF)-like protein